MEDAQQQQHVQTPQEVGHVLVILVILVMVSIVLVIDSFEN